MSEYVYSQICTAPHFLNVCQILKKNKFYYKIHPVRELSEDDFDRYVEFYENIM